MNKLVATLVAGAFAATSMIAVAQTSAPAATVPPKAEAVKPADKDAVKKDAPKADAMKKETPKAAQKATPKKDNDAGKKPVLKETDKAVEKAAAPAVTPTPAATSATPAPAAATPATPSTAPVKK